MPGKGVPLIYQRGHKKPGSKQLPYLSYPKSNTGQAHALQASQTRIYTTGGLGMQKNQMYELEMIVTS